MRASEPSDSHLRHGGEKRTMQLKFLTAVSLKHLAMCIICRAFCQQLHACYSCPPPSQSTFYKLYNFLTLILQDELSQPHMIHTPRHSQEPGPQTSCPTSTVSENANGVTSFMALPLVFQRFPGIWTTNPARNLHPRPLGHSWPLVSRLTLFLLRQFPLTFPIWVTFLSPVHSLGTSTHFLYIKHLNDNLTSGFSLDWPTLKTSSIK